LARLLENGCTAPQQAPLFDRLHRRVSGADIGRVQTSEASAGVSIAQANAVIPVAKANAVIPGAKTRDVIPGAKANAVVSSAETTNANSSRRTSDAGRAGSSSSAGRTAADTCTNTAARAANTGTCSGAGSATADTSSRADTRSADTSSAAGAHTTVTRSNASPRADAAHSNADAGANLRLRKGCYRKQRNARCARAKQFRPRHVSLHVFSRAFPAILATQDTACRVRLCGAERRCVTAVPAQHRRRLTPRKRGAEIESGRAMPAERIAAWTTMNACDRWTCDRCSARHRCRRE